MSQNHPIATIHIGIDIARDTLQLDPLHLKNTAQVPNTPAGCKKLLKLLQPLSGPHICLEATGGYERLLVDMLRQDNIALSVINPCRARAFARPEGLTAKTDAIDAAMLTRFGQKMQPAPTPVPTAVQPELAELMTRRKQIMDMAVMEKNRRRGLTLPALIKDAEKTRKGLEKSIAAIDEMVAELRTKDEELKKKVSRLTELQGIGVASACALLAALPELGTLGRREAAALGGLAPRNRDSGKFTGKRSIGGGRAAVRYALYMPALTASRMNPKLKALYQRLIAAGKPARLALTAVMRQMLTVMNSMLLVAPSLRCIEWFNWKGMK